MTLAIQLLVPIVMFTSGLLLFTYVLYKIFDKLWKMTRKEIIDIVTEAGRIIKKEEEEER